MVVYNFIAQNFVNFHVKIVVTAINRDFGGYGPIFKKWH